MSPLVESMTRFETLLELRCGHQVEVTVDDNEAA